MEAVGNPAMFLDTLKVATEIDAIFTVSIALNSDIRLCQAFDIT
jgi:hypothetical protein